MSQLITQTHFCAQVQCLINTMDGTTFPRPVWFEKKNIVANDYSNKVFECLFRSFDIYHGWTHIGGAWW